MKQYFAGAAVYFAAVTTALAQTYNLNGTVMQFNVNGTAITIEHLFDDSGTDSRKIFEGTVRINQVTGFAFLLIPGCGPFPYQVSGSFNRSWTTLRLNGAAPIVNRATCRVTRYSRTSKNSTRIFTADNRPVTE